MKSPLRWVGGKNAEAEYLAGLLPPHSCYAEVFGGGASVLLAKRPSEVEVYNDVNGELVNFFRVVKEHPAEFKESWRWCLVSRQEFYHLRDADLTDMDPIQRAHRFMYINRIAFGGDMNNSAFGVTARDRSLLLSWLDHLTEWTDALHQRLRAVYVENLTWDRLLDVWDGSKTGRDGAVFFLDPPYLETKEYAGVTFTEADHHRLSEALGQLRGRFLLTVNSHPAIRALYDGCDITERVKQYSLSRGGPGRREFGELIISNYPLPEQKQATLF